MNILNITPEEGKEIARCASFMQDFKMRLWKADLVHLSNENALDKIAMELFDKWVKK